jgi:hypothetical protein
MDDAQAFEIGSNGRVHCMHNDAFYVADAHPAQIDLARRVNIGKVAADCDRDFRRGAFSGSHTERAPWKCQLHHTQSHDCFTVTHLHDPSDLASQRVHRNEVSDVDLGRIARAGRDLGFTINTFQLSSLLIGEALDPLPRFARGFFSLLRGGLEIANRALDFRAGFEKILSGFLA